MILESQIRKWTTSILKEPTGSGVEVYVKPGNRILIFIDSDTSVLIDHCISLSRFIESHLDRDKEDF
jgi:ribosome maturation factor RimP